LKLNGTHQLLVNADDVNMLGGSVHTIKNTNPLVVVCKKTELEVNVEKNKYTGHVSRTECRGSHVIKIDSFFERVEQFRCLKTTLNF